MIQSATLKRPNEVLVELLKARRSGHEWFERVPSDLDVERLAAAGEYKVGWQARSVGAVPPPLIEVLWRIELLPCIAESLNLKLFFLLFRKRGLAHSDWAHRRGGWLEEFSTAVRLSYESDERHLLPFPRRHGLAGP
jgi:hypothetical protein